MFRILIKIIAHCYKTYINKKDNTNNFLTMNYIAVKVVNNVTV